MTEAHPEPAELAALDEDLLPESESREVRRHLAECTACAATVDELQALQQELAAVYPSEPMPERVAARIDAAIAAERSAVVSRETRRRWPAVALAAALASAVLGVGAVVLSNLDIGDSSADQAAAGAELGVAEEDAGYSSVEDAVRALLHPERDGEPFVAEGLESGDLGTEPTDTAPTDTAPTDDAASEGTEGEAWPTESLPHDPLDSAGADGATVIDPAAGSAPACAVSLIGRPEAPLASTSGFLYRGVEAYLVVLPHPDDAHLVDAYVVEPSCEAVMETGSYARD